MKIYIRAASAISPQHSFGQPFLAGEPVGYTDARLQNIEPNYTALLDPKALRSMSRIVKMGVAAASACLSEAAVNNPDAIITGTAYGCVEDTDIFLREAINRKEDTLTPTAFIQSTHNTVGAQVALQIKCHSYNNTFVHGGASFESALLDALLLLQEKEAVNVLVGGIDELTQTLFTLLSRFDLYKKQLASSLDLYQTQSKGTIAGEGAAFFLLTRQYSSDSYACLNGAATFYKPEQTTETIDEINTFLSGHFLKPDNIDLVIMGNNGNAEEDDIYRQVKQILFPSNKTLAYKHLCGEYPTSSSFALWLGATIIKNGRIPDALQPVSDDKTISRVLIYNHYQNKYHSLLLLTTAV